MEFVYRLMRLNSLVRGHRAKFVAASAAHTLGVRHLGIRLDPVIACNLKCQLCQFSSPEHEQRDIAKDSFSMEELERLSDMFFPLALQVVIGCAAEPTLHKSYSAIVGMAKQHGVPSVGLVTNGQMLNHAKLSELAALGLDELIVSLHGVHKETYERMMVGASYDKFMRVMESMRRLRNERGKKQPSLRLNYTVCPDNVEELGQIFTVLGEYPIDTLQVRPFMQWGGAYNGVGLQSVMDVYDNVMARLADEGKKRGITCLLNTRDPTHKGNVYSALIVDAVRRDVNPDLVWRSDFDWRHQTYREFCNSIHWGRHLLHVAIQKRPETMLDVEHTGNLQYDVL